MGFACVVVLLGAAFAFAAERAEIEVVFRQGVNHYTGCQLIDPWRTVIRKRESGTVNKYRLIFTDLKFAGKDVKILSAELRMKFAEEGWSRIPNAELELFDANVKDGRPLAVRQYRKHRIVGMDRKKKIITWAVPAELVKRWVDKPGTNKGLRFKITPDRKGPFQMIFRLPGNKVPELRPMLVVKYSFAGEAAPFAPDITTNVAGKTFGPRFTVAWQKKRWDPNGTPAVYEVAVGKKDGPVLVTRKADAEKLSVEIDTLRLPTADAYEVRMRAVDPEGLASEWVTASGEFRVSRREFVVWTQNSVTKVQREESPPSKEAPVNLSAARNEYESFQVVVTGLSNIKKADVAVGDLTGPVGAKISKRAFKLYRVHYVDCKGEGQLPDSMVPWRDPWHNKRIGGKFGAPFDVAGGTNALVWVELHVPTDAKPGDYKGTIEVTVAGKPVRTIPMSVTVWPVTLPKTTTLLTYMELSNDTPKRHAMHALHNHRMDVWRIPGVSHRLKWENDKPVVVFSAEYDGAMDDYFSGRVFADGVPGKRLLLTMESWVIYRTLKGKSDANRIAILKQYEAHYKNKPYVDKLRWFFIDEPNKKTLPKCVRVGKQIKQHSPSIKFLLTTRYNKDLVGLVDVWDAIINNEVINWDAPGPDPYRDEMKKGREVINCVTVNSNTPTSPNIFIHHKAMNTRIWTWATYAMDQQGIEFWNTAAAPSLLVPKKFGKVWGDGSLFYRGLKEELGIVEREIALPSIRLKILRDGIEDFELLSMLARKDRALAKKLCHRMVQETKDYDKSFAAPVQHISWNWNRDGKGDRKVPGYLIWESSPKRLAETRAAIAKALAGKE